MSRKGYLRPFSSGIGNISTANQELIDIPVTGEIRKYSTIQFFANADCTLIWNNKLELPIKKGAGLYLDDRFEPTDSLKIVDSGVEYFFIGGF